MRTLSRMWIVYKASPSLRHIFFSSPRSSSGLCTLRRLSFILDSTLLLPPFYLHYSTSLFALTMSSRMQSPDASNQSLPPGGIVALPSLSCSLSSLPQAMSMDSVSVHPTMYAQRAAESQAKVSQEPTHVDISPDVISSSQLQKALSVTASSFSPQNPPIVPAYMRPVRFS